MDVSNRIVDNMFERKMAKIWSWRLVKAKIVCKNVIIRGGKVIDNIFIAMVTIKSMVSIQEKNIFVIVSIY